MWQGLRTLDPGLFLVQVIVMHIIRKAAEEDLPRIHELQDVEFRDTVFVETLSPVDEFVAETKARLEAGLEHLYVQESDGSVTGFVRFLQKANGWEALTWGKWINTLAYASVILAFEKLGFSKLLFSVRLENKRVMHLYEKFDFRRTGVELYFYRTQRLGFIKTTNLQHFELTADEFREKAESMRKNSLNVIFA